MPDQEPPPTTQPEPDLQFALARIRELIAVSQANAVLTVATSALSERLGLEVAVLIRDAGLSDADLMAFVERVRAARSRMLETIAALTSDAK